jgi:hypothetical protein
VKITCAGFERGAVVSVVGRLKPGVTVERAQSDLNLIARRIEQANPKQSPGAQMNVLPLGEKIVGNLRRALSTNYEPSRRRWRLP